MSVAKVIEITSQSPASFDDAIKKGIAKASETVNGIQGAWISEQKIICRGAAVTAYRVTMRVTFVVD